MISPVFRRPSVLFVCVAALLASQGVLAQEAVIKKAFAERFPDFPKIDEISKTPVAGLFEVRVGNNLFYSDEQGNYLIEGVLIDTKSRVNLTEARLDKINAIDISTLPIKDAIVVKQGNGSRKLVIFADPNCGYCKKFERDLIQAKDVTVYSYLYPILGNDSTDKSRNIWCAKDSAKTWRAWMIDGVTPPKAGADCDASVLQRNVELGRKHRVNGTPALVFEDGKRVPGAMPLEALERQLSLSKSKS